MTYATTSFAMVFPGQGSQKQGMLADLAAEYAEVKAAFAEASAAIGHDLWDIAQNNPEGRLDQTQFTQPALLAASVAVWRVWQARGGAAAAVLAGHSLGEYSALVCSGALGFQDAAKLVHQRGQFMQEAVPAGQGKMAAIVGLEDAQLQKLCTQAAGDNGSAEAAVVAPSNFNSPGQTVIAGHAAAVDRAIELCKAAGAKRAMPLQVSVPSHCALMQPAAERLAAELDKVQIKPPAIPVVQNVNGEVCKKPAQIRDNLVRQLSEPVQWVRTVHTIHKAGARLAIECGPGKVLGGLIRRTEPDLNCCACDDPKSLHHALEQVQS